MADKQTTGARATLYYQRARCSDSYAELCHQNPSYIYGRIEVELEGTWSNMELHPAWALIAHFNLWLSDFCENCEGKKFKSASMMVF